MHMFKCMCVCVHVKCTRAQKHICSEKAKEELYIYIYIPREVLIFWNMTEHSVLNKVCPQGKLSYWSLTNWGYQHLTGIKNGSIQLHVLVAFLSLWGRNYIQKNTRLWRPQPSDTGSLKYPIWGLQNVPLPPPTHTHTHILPPYQ